MAFFRPCQNTSHAINGSAGTGHLAGQADAVVSRGRVPVTAWAGCLSRRGLADQRCFERFRGDTMVRLAIEKVEPVSPGAHPLGRGPVFPALGYGQRGQVNAVQRATLQEVDLIRGACREAGCRPVASLFASFPALRIDFNQSGVSHDVNSSLSAAADVLNSTHSLDLFPAGGRSAVFPGPEGDLVKGSVLHHVELAVKLTQMVWLLPLRVG